MRSSLSIQLYFPYDFRTNKASKVSKRWAQIVIPNEFDRYKQDNRMIDGMEEYTSSPQSAESQPDIRTLSDSMSTWSSE